MTDIIPKQIKFIFKNKENNVIPKILAYYILISKKKNNYSIGPLVSNNNGEIVITKELIENIIYQNKIDFPMDYNGELKDCTHLKVLIETKDELEKRINILKEFYPNNALFLKKLTVDCNNKDFHYDKIFTFPITDRNILITLE